MTSWTQRKGLVLEQRIPLHGGEQAGWVEAFWTCHRWGWWGDVEKDPEMLKWLERQVSKFTELSCDAGERKMEAGRSGWSLREWKMFRTCRIWLAVSKRPQIQASQQHPHWAHTLNFLRFSPACWKPSPLQALAPKSLWFWNLLWEPILRHSCSQ